MSKIDVEAVVVAWLNGILPSGLDAYGDKPDPAPVVASDVPLMTIPMPASSFGTLDLGILGKRFATGIAQTANQSSNPGINSGYTTDNTGGGGAHNNLQPYIVVRMWKRTA